MPRNYVRKPPATWLRPPNTLPHAPAHDRYIIVKEEAGRLLYIDADLDYLFRRDERMTRRVWTEGGVAYTEEYSPHTVLFGEGGPTTLTLDQFVYCAWHAIEKLPRWIVGFEHKDGGTCDFRINNLEPIIDRALMPKAKPKKKKSKAA